MSYPQPYPLALTVEGRQRQFERKVLAAGCLVLAALSTDPVARPLIPPLAQTLTEWAESGQFPEAAAALHTALVAARRALLPAWHPVLDGIAQLLIAAQEQDWIALGRAVRMLAAARPSGDGC